MASYIPFRLPLAFILFLPALSGSYAKSTSPYQQEIRDAAFRASLDPRLVEAVIRVESNFNKKAVSRKGAQGLMQVMPQTADAVGIYNPNHALNNLMGACQYLREMLNRYRGNLELALAAYNAGPANVDKHGGIPPFKETRQYVQKVLRIYDKLKKMG